MKPRYLQIFESIGMEGAISDVAADTLRIMLNANWQVTVVANQLSEEFQSQVEWRRLHMPKKLFAYKWLSARHYLLKAWGHDQFDITHAHQPQISDCVDIFQCHYLTRAAANSNALSSWKGRQGPSRFQEEIVLRVEDRYMKRLQRASGPQAPHILFNSELTKDQFIDLYGSPQKPDVLICPAPAYCEVTGAERQIQREKWVPEADNKIVVGFLGGGIERKGFRQVIKAVGKSENTFLLLGGPRAKYVDDSAIGRMKNIGFVRDKPGFYAACDVFVIASTFEPLGMVALEAASYGIPVIATPSVGALKTMQKYGAALAWTNESSFADLCVEAMREKDKMRLGAQRFCKEMGQEAYHSRFIKLCESIKEAKPVKGESSTVL